MWCTEVIKLLLLFVVSADNDKFSLFLAFDAKRELIKPLLSAWNATDAIQGL